MKLHANMYHVNKQPSLEDGTMKYEIMDENCTTTIDRKSNRCNRWLQLMKVILYIELILFIGWIGCVFITNYYQPHNFNGTAEQHGASKWTQEPEKSTNQDDFETTTVKSQTPPKFVSETENVNSHVEIVTTTEIIEPDERDEKAMVHWMHSWAKGRGSWDDSSSESSSSQDKIDWDPAERGTFNRNTDEAASIVNHFGLTNEDDELELNYLLTFPLWHNVIFTSDSLAESVDSDKDSFDESTEDYGRSRQTRSADDESSSSSSSSSEESDKPGDGPDAANGESSNEDECATVVDDDGNVANEARDGNDWVSLLKEADIPDCEKSKVAKSVTVNRCGKIAVTCVDDEKDDAPMKHHRRARNTETKNAAVESCKQRFTLWLKNLEVWKAWIVQEGSAGQMVQEVYQNIQEHVRTLIREAIDDRTSGKPRKTEEDWRNSLISIKRNIAKLIDSEGRNLFVNDNELTSKMGASLGEIVQTAVDIRMDCHEILSTLSPTLDTMMKEQQSCHQAAETMTLFDNKFAAEVVPGDATNPEVRRLRRLFKPHALVLVFDIIQYRNTNVPSGMSHPVDLTDEQLTSYIRGLKGKMLHFANYTSLRTQLENRLLPTSEETNLLREMVNYYSLVNESCSMAHLQDLMMALNTRKTRAVSADPPTFVTCTLDDDDIQYMHERKERFERYEQSRMVNTGTVRIRPLLDVIEERMNGTPPTESSDADIEPTHMSYIRALNVFMGNSSTELKNESYRLFRDIVLESKYLEDNETATEGYSLDALMQNWTVSCLMHIDDNYTAETILMAVIKLGEALNLHYTGAEENKNCGEAFTPVYGTFTYVGEEPEKSIVRKWRHIFEGIVKVYFAIRNPEALSYCTNDKEAGESSTIPPCGSEDDLAQFHQERQERLDRYDRAGERTMSDSRTEPFLDAIQERLNGINSTANSDDKPAPPYMPYMNIFNAFAGNSSTDLKNEGYRLLQDIIWESKYMDDNAPAAMEGYSVDTIKDTWVTNCLKDIGDNNYTAEIVLIAAMKFAEGMDLHYSGLDSGKKCGEPFTPTYGTFTYVGQAPEKSLVRRWRHMLNAMARLYFKMYNPEVLPKLNCKEESHTLQTNTGEVVARMGKRSIGHPSRRSASDITCTSDDDDDAQFMQEREERFERYEQSRMVNTGTVRIRPLLDVIEERLNDTAPTESSDADIKPAYVSYIRVLNVFMGNTSTELKNEGYRLFRDIVLESKYLEDNETATEGYSLDALMQNWTASCLMHIDDDYTAETILMAVIKLGETLNLHYTGAEENKNCGDEFKPVYGTFTYVGEEPEKSIVRKWRHIFGGIVKLYFAIRKPEALAPCTNNEEGGESSTTATCGSKDDLAQFDQERQERLDRYNRIQERAMSDSRTEPFLGAIQEKLNGENSTADSDDKPAPPYMPYMNIFNAFAGNSSTDLKNEGYRLLQDIILESKYMDDNAPAAMEGYSVDTIKETWVTNCLKDIGDNNYTAEIVLIAAMKFAEGMDLHYTGLDSGKKCGEPFTPTYGTFTYVGQAPEKSLVRRWRHMLNAMARLYFKMYNPEVLPELNCKEETRTPETNTGDVVARMGKRSIGHRSRRSASDIACASDDDDAQFMQERKERLDRYDQSIIITMENRRLLSLLDTLEERLNGTAPTESSDEHIQPTNMPYIKALNVFMGNTSTELKNEGYRLLRDMVLEAKYLEHNETANEGYDLDAMMRNWTGSCLMHFNEDYTAENILMAVIKLGETVDLHYSGAEENKNCGDEFTPIWGTFSYVGEEPEKSIVRKWRHIFGSVVKLYFDIHNPEALASCTNDKEGSESSTTTTCISKDDIAQFDQERQERLDRYNEYEKRIISDSRTEPFLDAIEEKMNGVTSTEDSDDKPAPPFLRYMNIFDVFAGNSSTDLKNKGYMLLRDIVLELKYMDDNKPAAMEGYSIDTIMEAWMTNCLQDIGDNYTAEMVLVAAMKVAESIDLRYSGLDSGKKCGEQFTPAYGTFTYVGQAPEKSFVRRWRHMFNAMSKLYFKMYSPDVLPQSDCKEESPTAKTNTGAVVARMGKRSIGHPSRRTDNSVDVDEKYIRNDNNGRLIKVNLDHDAEPRNLDLSQDSFIDKMEMLSAHIDRLHDMYQRYNELNDDYVSQEFPVDRTSNYKY